MARNQQIRRQWRLWMLLNGSPVPLSARELAAELGCDDVASARTLRRDLEVLREIGVPIREQRDGRDLRYHALGNGPELKLDNFLKRLSQQNGGRYRYQDVTRFDKE